MGEERELFELAGVLPAGVNRGGFRPPTRRAPREAADLNEKLVDEIEHFFVSYNAVKGKRFKPLGRNGPERARELVNGGTIAAR
ncbi:MAG: hypothetical protein H0T11_06485 [Chthoniobacterales bacterium]|nr:hypothetical protein [Chthoniobacterales bacterium]